VIKLKQVIAAVFPDQNRISGALRSSARGASVALSAVVATSALLAVVLLISEKTSDLASILLAGSAVAIGSFGAMLLVEPSGASLPALGAELSFGLHSVTVAAITLAVVHSLSRRASKADISYERSELSPIHLAVGFTAMTFGISYIAQGLAVTTVGQVAFRGMTLLSAAFVFALVWAASYAGKIRGRSGSSDFEYVWKWITKAIKNFVVIYTVLIVFAFVVLFIRNLIEPKYAIASEPVAMSLNLSPDQGLWVLVGFILYGANLLIQFFLMAMGINVGLDVQGSQGLTGLLSSLDANLLGNASQWLFNLIGPWGYMGVLVLVTLVAFVSGAKAADQVGAKFHGVSTYLKALFIGLFVSLSIVFLASIQLSVEVTPLEGEVISSGLVWGASTLAVFAFGTFFIFLAHQSAGRSFDFMATAFPRLVQGKRNSGLRGEAHPGARVFGLVAIAAILLVAATPIAASTVNRVSALTDGPNQVGENASKTLTSAPIKELKEFLNPNASRAHNWLSSKVLEAAQPSEGYTSKVLVVNGLDKSWEPGNLDATIIIELEKDGKTISKTFETTSTQKTSGLLTTVKYEPVVSPTTVEVQLSKFLKGQKDLAITLNGEKLKPGKYFAIPGVYKTKAAGYKLVAATESTIYVENESQLIKIGYNVALPAGGAAKLDSAIQAKADKCLKVSKAGSGTCVTKDQIVKGGTLADGTSEPEKYYDFRDYNFESGSPKCDKGNRKDSLVTSSKSESSTVCQTDVVFSRDYYETASRQVPNYVFENVCSPGWLAPNGLPGRITSYDAYWDVYIFTDTSGRTWWETNMTYDNCATTTTRRVQDGTKTELYRGAKISTVTLNTKVSKELVVTGSLLANGEFRVAE
jgi:hypothetical protein